jgi:drug/metabolite transporter (DMT)-like permease
MRKRENMKETSKKTIGHLIALFTIVIWGTTFIASKFLLEVFTPIQIMIMRFTIAYVVLLILNHKREKLRLKEEAGFLLLALTGCTIYFISENVALTYTFASNVSIIVASAPILTAILAHFFTKDEKISLNIILGFLIAFTGVAFVVFNGTFILKLSPVGDLLSFLAALSWAIYSINLKRYLVKYDSVYLARKTTFYAILTTVPLAIFENAPFALSALEQPKYIISILFLGIVGSAICYVAWNTVSRRIGIVTANNYIYVIPFVTLIAAGIMLNEKVSIISVVGAVLIVCGVAVSGRRKVLKN